MNPLIYKCNRINKTLLVHLLYTALESTRSSNVHRIFGAFLKILYFHVGLWTNVDFTGVFGNVIKICTELI